MYDLAEDPAPQSRKSPKASRRPPIPPAKPPNRGLVSQTEAQYSLPSKPKSNGVHPTTDDNKGGNYRPPPPARAAHAKRVLPMTPKDTIPPPIPKPFEKVEYDSPDHTSPCYDQPSGFFPNNDNPPKPTRQPQHQNIYNPPYSVSTLTHKSKVEELRQYGRALDRKSDTNSEMGNSVFYDSVNEERDNDRTRCNSDDMLYDVVDQSTDHSASDAEEYYSEVVEPQGDNGFQLKRLQNQIGVNAVASSNSNSSKYKSLPRPKRPQSFQRIRAFTQVSDSPETDQSKGAVPTSTSTKPRLPERPPLPLPKKPPMTGNVNAIPNSDHSSLFEAQSDKHHSKEKQKNSAESKPPFHKKFSLVVRPKVGHVKSNLNKDSSVSMPALNSIHADVAQSKDNKRHDQSDGFRSKLPGFLRPKRQVKSSSSADLDAIKAEHRQSAPVFSIPSPKQEANAKSSTANLQRSHSNQPKMDWDLRKKLAFQKQRSEQQGIFIEEENQKQISPSSTTHNTDMPLFESVLVVTLKEEGGRLVPCISFQFPPKASNVTDHNDRLQQIPDFCFPDIDGEGSSPRLSIGYGRSETFSFVLTDMAGNRHFGYCRHVMEDSFGPAVKPVPKVFCIISSLGLFSLYSQVLDEVEKQQLNSPATVFSLLKTVLSQPLPLPGETLNMQFYSSGAKGIENITLKRPGDSAIHAHVDLRILFDTLPVAMILSVVTSLLMERRVILCSSSLSVLSACCHGCISLLYPFIWQHTYIPVLPRKLIDICCSPTPYLLGVLSACLPEVLDSPTCEVIIVDLDNRKFIDQGDSQNFFPKTIRDEMEKTLTTVNSESRKRDSFIFKEHRAKNKLITEVFVQAYIQMIGWIEDHIALDSTGERTFQEESFCKASNSKEIRKFRKNFIQTQSFLLFLQPWLDGHVIGNETGLFEQRLLEWKETRKMDFHSFASRVRELLPKSKSAPQEGGGFQRFIGKLTAK